MTYSFSTFVFVVWDSTKFEIVWAEFYFENSPALASQSAGTQECTIIPNFK